MFLLRVVLQVVIERCFYIQIYLRDPQPGQGQMFLPGQIKYSFLCRRVEVLCGSGASATRAPLDTYLLRWMGYSWQHTCCMREAPKVCFDETLDARERLQVFEKMRVQVPG